MVSTNATVSRLVDAELTVYPVLSFFIFHDQTTNKVAYLVVNTVEYINKNRSDMITLLYFRFQCL